MIRIRHAARALAVAAVLCAPPALAHMGAKGVVKERMDAMSNMGKAMKALNAAARSKETFDADGAAKIAQGLDRHAGRIATLFPKGSGKRPSEAKPEIWTDWQGFTRAATSLSEETAKLVRAAQSGDRTAFAGQFRAVGRACSACHKEFRAKREGH